MPGEGPTHTPIVFVGEAPGRAEDAAGRPFVGAAGRIFDEALRTAGIVRERTFVTNVVKCRPPGNRRPRAAEMAACRPYLIAQLTAIRPRVVVALGDSAIRDVLGPGARLADLRGRWRTRHGFRVLATYHPAAVLYNRRLSRVLVTDLRKAKAAAGLREGKLSGPPRRGRRMLPALSAGCVIIDEHGRALLLRRIDEDTWCFPKGGVERGETLRAAARRETREECGLDVDVGEQIAEVRYQVYWPPDDVNYDKRVVYFLAAPRAGRLRLEQGFRAWRWVDPKTAAKLLPYANDRRVLRAAYRARQALPPKKPRISS